MSRIRAPKPVKLFIGMLSSDPELVEACVRRLCDDFGPVGLRSADAPWEHTGYYDDEMGGGLRRTFFVFERLIDPGDLARIKNFTNSIEEETGIRSAAGTRRRVNLDPGYVTEAKVVLASAKDFSHRVYIGGNIYAEVTLRYDKNMRGFVPLEHTYPDFRPDATRALFNTARDLLRDTLRKSAG